jgi:hypothetical protein
MARATAEFFLSQGQGEGHHITASPQSNSPLVIYLLSDLSAGVNGQVVRLQGEELSLMTHPAVLFPGIESDSWTVAAVADAFADVLGKRQLPLGVRAYDLEVRPYSVPYAGN